MHYKIIAKIMAERLYLIASEIVSPQQGVFIKGRQISDCVIATFECINLLDQKIVGGNMALKLDIVKTFDTIEWSFLLQTL